MEGGGRKRRRRGGAAGASRKVFRARIRARARLRLAFSSIRPGLTKSWKFSRAEFSIAEARPDGEAEEAAIFIREASKRREFSSRRTDTIGMMQRVMRKWRRTATSRTFRRKRSRDFFRLSCFLSSPFLFSPLPPVEAELVRNVERVFRCRLH